MLWAFQLGYYLHLFEVPKQNCVVKTARDDHWVVVNLLFSNFGHLCWVDKEYFNDSLSVTLHIMCFNTFLYSERFHSKVCLYEQEPLSFSAQLQLFLGSPIGLLGLILFCFFVSLLADSVTLLNNLNSSYFFLARSLNYDLVLLVHVDNINESLFIGCVKFLLQIVPVYACVAAFLRIFECDELFVALGHLKPHQLLILSNSEENILLLNY
jgi:hypothetical protein